MWIGSTRRHGTVRRDASVRSRCRALKPNRAANRPRATCQRPAKEPCVNWSQALRSGSPTFAREAGRPARVGEGRKRRLRTKVHVGRIWHEAGCTVTHLDRAAAAQSRRRSPQPRPFGCDLCGDLSSLTGEVLCTSSPSECYE